MSENRKQLMERNRRPRVPGGPAPGMADRMLESSRRKESVVRSKKCTNVPSVISEHCDLCGRVLTIPQMDHDHGTGLFRGWLCRRCNTGLGFLGDTIESLQRAIAYLRKSTRITELPEDTEIA